MSDSIRNAAFRALPIPAIVAVTNIINGMLQLRDFSKNWKHTIITSIPKPGENGRCPQNYKLLY